jgi:HEAT repeats
MSTVPSRREVVVAGHTGATETARLGLISTDPATRSAALRAVSRLGYLTSNDLVVALRDSDQSVVRSAIEIAAYRNPDSEIDIALDQHDRQDVTKKPVAEPEADDTIDQLLLVFLLGADAVLSEVAAWCLGERWQERDDPGVDEVVSGLMQATRTHAEPLVREAAVAALGAVGQPVALKTVLAALDDKATIRRRAVIALAAFEGPEVEHALTKARNDRDWQVRQSAEDLLQ